MWGFVLIVISVVVALIGVIKDNKAKAEERAFAFGLNRLGVVLLTLTFFGFVAGLGKEINDSRVLQEDLHKESRDREILLKRIGTIAALDRLKIIEDDFKGKLESQYSELNAMDKWLENLPKQVKTNRRSDRDPILSVSSVRSKAETFPKAFDNEMQLVLIELDLLESEQIKDDISELTTDIEAYREEAANILDAIGDYMQEYLLPLLENDMLALYDGKNPPWESLEKSLEEPINDLQEGVQTLREEIEKLQHNSMEHFLSMRKHLAEE